MYILIYADHHQLLLRDGRGACFAVEPAQSDLPPFSSRTVTLRALSDMWGQYQDRLVIRVCTVLLALLCVCVCMCVCVCVCVYVCVCGWVVGVGVWSGGCIYTYVRTYIFSSCVCIQCIRTYVCMFTNSESVVCAMHTYVCLHMCTVYVRMTVSTYNMYVRMRGTCTYVH